MFKNIVVFALFAVLFVYSMVMVWTKKNPVQIPECLIPDRVENWIEKQAEEYVKRHIITSYTVPK